MITRCNNGHWYDTSVYQECPHCKQDSERLGIHVYDMEEDDKTIPLTEIDSSLSEEVGMILGTSKGETEDLLMKGNAFSDEDDDKTIAFGLWGVMKCSPVVGWLVCMNDSERGRDYRLHAGKNFIGRGTSMDIMLVEDKTITRDKHGAVIYDPKGNSFYVTSEGGNLVYLNGQLLEESNPLKEGDVITIGKTDLMFLPFCKEGRTWERK